MTKEELEKEAREWVENEIGKDGRCVRAYLAGAEPREKQIAELKKQLDWKEKALSKAKKETKRIANKINKDRRRLIRRKTEFEAQLVRENYLNQCMSDHNEQLREMIKKMKCCYNCSKWNDGQCADEPNDSSYYSADFVCKDWEIKENGK